MSKITKTACSNIRTYLNPKYLKNPVITGTFFPVSYTHLRAHETSV